MKTNLCKAIESHPFFRGMRPDHLEIITTGASEAMFNEGEMIFAEGDPANRFFLVQSGRVALEARSAGEPAVRLQELGAGETLGWSWLFPPYVWHLNARALEPTWTVVLSGGHLLASAERDREFGFELMKRVAQMLIRRLAAAREKLVEHEVRSALEG